jgi:hypothetical protein
VLAYVRVEPPVGEDQGERRDGERGEREIARGVSEVVDRVAGDDRAGEMAARVAEAEGRKVAGALLGRAECAAERLVGHVEEDEADTDEDCGEEERRERRPGCGQHEPEEDQRDAGEHRAPRAVTVRNASRVDAKHQRKYPVDTDQKADGESARAELEREQRRDDAAADMSALDEERVERCEVDRGHGGRAAGPRERCPRISEP